MNSTVKIELMSGSARHFDFAFSPACTPQGTPLWNSPWICNEAYVVSFCNIGQTSVNTIAAARSAAIAGIERKFIGFVATSFTSWRGGEYP
jgi:hypothetical protein